MSLSTTEAVRDTFFEATRQSLTRALRTGEDWDRFQTIVKDTNQRLDAERATFTADYPQRLAEAREIILREEYGVRLDQPLPPDAQAFSNKDALDHKAAFRVRQDHDRRIAAIKVDELDHYRKLTADIRSRDAPDQSRSLGPDRTLVHQGPTRT